MSSYQYYEFVTVGRRLTKKEMDALRAVSTRATITPTRFVNVYNYGDLKADPTALLAKYFDARVYLSNFGDREFAVRVPKTALPAKSTKPFEDGRTVKVHRRGECAVVTFTRYDEEGSGWIDDTEGAGWMRDLLGLRDRLLRGDLSPLYVAWLSTLDLYQDGDEEDGDEVEPPVPPALDESAELRSLADFFGVEALLLRAAAEGAKGGGEAALTPAAVKRWVAEQPATKQLAWLTRAAMGDGAAVGVELATAFQRANAPKAGRGRRRTVAALIERAQELHERARTRRKR